MTMSYPLSNVESEFSHYLIPISGISPVILKIINIFNEALLLKELNNVNIKIVHLESKQISIWEFFNSIYEYSYCSSSIIRIQKGIVINRLCRSHPSR